MQKDKILRYYNHIERHKKYEGKNKIKVRKMSVFRFGQEQPSIFISRLPSIGSLQQWGHSLRLSFGTSQVMYFDWRLAPAWKFLSSEPGLSASVPLAGPFCLIVLFDWRLKAVRECLSTEPGSQWRHTFWFCLLVVSFVRPGKRG